MCLEAYEVLNAVHWNMRLKPGQHTPERDEVPDGPHLPPYRRSLSQRMHPVCRWAGLDRANYVWTLRHAKALAKEHKRRYGNSYPMPYIDCHNWVKIRTHKVPTRFRKEAVRASRLHYYGAFNDRWVLEYFGSNVVMQYRLQLLAKWLHDYKRRHTWHDGPPDWAHDDKLLRLVRKHRGKPTTATAKELGLL